MKFLVLGPLEVAGARLRRELGTAADERPATSDGGYRLVAGGEAVEIRRQFGPAGRGPVRVCLDQSHG